MKQSEAYLQERLEEAERDRSYWNKLAIRTLDERDEYHRGYLAEQQARLTMQYEVNRIEAERDALVAHVERISQAWDRYDHTDPLSDEEVQAELVIVEILKQSPKTSLARHDALKQAEALDRVKQLLKETHMDKAPTVPRAAMHVDDAINRVKQECRPLELRHQAEESTP